MIYQVSFHQRDVGLDENGRVSKRPWKNAFDTLSRTLSWFLQPGGII